MAHEKGPEGRFVAVPVSSKKEANTVGSADAVTLAARLNALEHAFSNNRIDQSSIMWLNEPYKVGDDVKESLIVTFEHPVDLRRAAEILGQVAIEQTVAEPSEAQSGQRMVTKTLPPAV